jgi:uncharacterized protein YdaT
LALQDEIDALEKQKFELERDSGQTTANIPEEIEKLTQKVKETNAEILKIEQHTSSTFESINKLREEISQVEQLIADSKSSSKIIVSISLPIRR